MKTKLLKKIRKRFSIIYLPKGGHFNNNFYNYECCCLINNDTNDVRISVKIVEKINMNSIYFEEESKILAKQFLLRFLLLDLKEKYLKLKNIKKEKLWFKK